MIAAALAKLLDRQDLTFAEAEEAMRAMMSGEATSAQIAALLTALRMKGETIDEIAGFASAMRAKAERVAVAAPVTDTCGTGGDGLGTINISTAAAFVAVGAGLTVAKHGNRGMSSRSGSADVLEALGFVIDLGPEHVAQCIAESGFGFLFAQRFHPAMKHVAPTRRELGVRTVFNVLGPLTNPAGAAFQVIGVPDATLAPKMANALRQLGVRHALVVVGHDGMDELSLAGPSRVYRVSPDGVTESTVAPEEVGLAPAPVQALAGGDPATNAAAIRAVFAGERGPRRDVIALNAAAALFVAGAVDSLKAGVALADDVIASGAAAAALDKAVAASQKASR